MNLYGYRFDENHHSIQKKAYYCKLIADTRELANQITYRPIYQRKGTIHHVLEEALSDRTMLYDPICRYVSTELQTHGIYWYDSKRILDACDMLSGHFLGACLELYEECCKAANGYNQAKAIRELRKESRTRIRALGANVPSLVVGMLEAGTVNFASGIAYTAINAVGNLLSQLEYADQLVEIYKSHSTYQRLATGLKQDCAQLPQIIAYTLCRESGDDWAYPFTRKGLAETEAVIHQIQQQMIPRAEWPRLMVDCIVNRASYHAPLYTFAERILGSDAGNLIATAKLFSVAEYYKAKEEQEKRNQSYREYLERTKTRPEAFFGKQLPAAKMFLSRSGVDDQIYSRLEDQISPDFNAMINVLLRYRKFVVNGRAEGKIFDQHTRSHLIFFEFDFPSIIEKQQRVTAYCNMCHVQSGATPYVFVDTTNFASRSKGFVITNQGFYFSEPCSIALIGEPVQYCNIDSMSCGILDNIQITYTGKDVKLNLPPIPLLNNFLIFTCMYFKYGQFKGED